MFASKTNLEHLYKTSLKQFFFNLNFRIEDREAGCFGSDTRIRIRSWKNPGSVSDLIKFTLSALNVQSFWIKIHIYISYYYFCFIITLNNKYWKRNRLILEGILDLLVQTKTGSWSDLSGKNTDPDPSFVSCRIRVPEPPGWKYDASAYSPKTPKTRIKSSSQDPSVMIVCDN